MLSIEKQTLAREASSNDAYEFSQLWLLIKVNLIQGLRKLIGIREKSWLFISIIFFAIIGYLVFTFSLFHAGFRFISNFPGLGSILIERLQFLAFATLMILLLFSSIIISYASMFRNRETWALLSLPIDYSTLLKWKIIESSVLASWAFIFLVSPLVAAYGVVCHVSWHFYVYILLAICFFIWIPSITGGFLSIIIGRFVDNKLFQLGFILVAIFFVLTVKGLFSPVPVPEDLTESRIMVVIDRLLAKSDFSVFPFLPSYWLTKGILSWAEGATLLAGFYLLTILSYAMFWWALISRLGPFFYSAFSSTLSRVSIFQDWSLYRKNNLSALEALNKSSIIEWVLRKIPLISWEAKYLILKDLRVFGRDTTQWSQTLILLGLFIVYVFNLRQFKLQNDMPFWINLVSFLNLFVCSTQLATMATRFVFPQFSLEGKRAWIIGIAPIGLVRAVKIKFYAASVLVCGFGLLLMVMSCKMLDLSLGKTIYFCGVVSVMGLALTGIAIGFGSLYPNFKEDNPNKIVSGFGGSLCLILSSLYIIFSTFLLAIGVRWQYEVDVVRLTGPGFITFIIISLVCTILPYRAGLRNIGRMELP